MDGIITFFVSHQAMRAERVLRESGLSVKLVPGPRELSPSCGVALRFPFDQADQAKARLAEAAVEVEMVVHYPEVREAPAGWRRYLGLAPADGR